MLCLELMKMASVKVGTTVDLLIIGDTDLVSEAPILIARATEHLRFPYCESPRFEA